MKLKKSTAAKQQGGYQYIKSKDDRFCVRLSHRDSSKPEKNEFLLCSSDREISWAKKNTTIKPKDLRQRIEPWLTSLFQSEHLSLLVGSGLTQAVHKLASNKDMRGMEQVNFKIFDKEIKQAVKSTSEKAGRGEGNFEDQIRVANDLLKGLTIVNSKKSETSSPFSEENIKKLEKALDNMIGEIASLILEGEANLRFSGTEGDKAINYLVNFLMSFASRSGARERLHIFTTNYDRYIETGADVAGLRLIDRFVGILEPIFRSSRLDIDLHYNPPGLRGEPRYMEGVARFTKLHGSIDWVDCGNSIRRISLPFGVADFEPYLSAVGPSYHGNKRVMIYPNSAKDRETTFYPFTELFRDFAAAICRPNSTLICYGYGFGDQHINRVICDMLTIPSTHLVIISRGDPLGRINKMYKDIGRPAQITFLLGDHLGDLKNLVEYYLPKPSIDLISTRMTKLLRSRIVGDTSSANHLTSE